MICVTAEITACSKTVMPLCIFHVITSGWSICSDTWDYSCK